MLLVWAFAALGLKRKGSGLRGDEGFRTRKGTEGLELNRELNRSQRAQKVPPKVGACRSPSQAQVPRALVAENRHLVSRRRQPAEVYKETQLQVTTTTTTIPTILVTGVLMKRNYILMLILIPTRQGSRVGESRTSPSHSIDKGKNNAADGAKHGNSPSRLMTYDDDHQQTQQHHHHRHHQPRHTRTHCY